MKISDLGPQESRTALSPSLSLKESESVSHSVVSDSAIPWTVARQAPLSMEFFRQEYWSGFPFPSPGDFPDPGIEPRSHALQADSLLLSHQGSTEESLNLR